MRELRIFFITATCFFILSCDPPRQIFGVVKINAQVVNPKDSINLGDSVVFYFEVPDTIEYNNSRIATFATDKDGGVVSLFPNWINVVANHIDGLTGSFYANPGSVVNRISLRLATINGHLRGKFYFIPPKKGVYYLEGQEMGFIHINNAAIKANATFSFGTINRHHQLILDNADPSFNWAGFLQDKANRGLEVYAFYVK